MTPNPPQWPADLPQGDPSPETGRATLDAALAAAGKDRRMIFDAWDKAYAWVDPYMRDKARTAEEMQSLISLMEQAAEVYGGADNLPDDLSVRYEYAKMRLGELEKNAGA